MLVGRKQRLVAARIAGRGRCRRGCGRGSAVAVSYRNRRVLVRLKRPSAHSSLDGDGARGDACSTSADRGFSLIDCGCGYSFSGREPLIIALAFDLLMIRPCLFTFIGRSLRLCCSIKLAARPPREGASRSAR